MKIRQLHTRVWVPRPLEEVFAFFADAHNLDQLTPPWLAFHIETPAPIEMQAGTLIDYKLSVRGIPMRWRSEITVWDPPHRFVDEQRRGPYRQWHHEHRFSAHEGGTMIEDHVHYAAPGWILEPVIHGLFVRPDVQKIFAFRGSRMEELFGAVPASPAAELTS